MYPKKTIKLCTEIKMADSFAFCCQGETVLHGCTAFRDMSIVYFPRGLSAK